MGDNKPELDIIIRNLCILVHTELESIGGDLKQNENLTEIIRLNSFKALDYISNAIESALTAKKSAKENSYYKDFLNNELYQKEMQKLENEIRNHIKIEQQMKLYADALEEKNIKLENIKKELKKSFTQKIDQKRAETKKISNSISMLLKELDDIKKQNESSNRDVSKIKSKENLKFRDIDKNLSKVDNEHEKISKIILNTELEYNQHKKDNEELKILLKEYLGTSEEENKEQKLMFKNKYDQKCAEVDLLKKKLKFLEKIDGKKRTARSITPSISKTTHVQSHKIIKKVSSVEKLKSKGLEKTLNKTDRELVSEKKRLPMSFTTRR